MTGMLDKTPRPACPDCETRNLACAHCDDVRPTAEKLAEGWRLLTPLGRWESVLRVDQVNPFAPILVWTDQTGEWPWSFPRWRRLDAREPERTRAGNPVVFVTDVKRGPIFAVAGLDTEPMDIVIGDGILVQATRAKPSPGWEVRHWPDPTQIEPTVIAFPDKAKALSQVKRLAREYAKKLGVKVHYAPTSY